MNESPSDDFAASTLGRFAASWSRAWNNFWFSKRDPGMLGLIRIFVGSIVFYTHIVWTFGLDGFLGNQAVLPSNYRDQIFGNSFAWSHFDLVSSHNVLFVLHIVAILVIAMFTVGLFTRWTSVLTALIVISYANRATGALFGLDQLNAFLCLYLAVGNSGGAWSIDALRFAKRETDQVARAGQGGRLDTSTNISIRLIQVHMCVVYLFAGIGKLQGETWLTGEAIWLALASYEYQTLDMTWLSGHLWFVSIITLVTLAWEVGYPALVWPKLTRPIVLALAIPIHLGIGICMGMMTFGLIMLAGNLAFIEPRSRQRK